MSSPVFYYLTKRSEMGLYDVPMFGFGISMMFACVRDGVVV